MTVSFPRASTPSGAPGNRQGRVVLFALVLVVLAAGSVPTAHAQQAIGESVEGRSRPEYDPLGIELGDLLGHLGRLQVGKHSAPAARSLETLGSYILNTEMGFETAFDDNIFRTDTGAVSDTIFRFQPKFIIKSDWSNHEMHMELGGNFGRYADHPTENFDDFNAGIGGRLDFDEGENLVLNLTWQKNHSDRGSLDDVNEPKPTISTSTGFSAVYLHDRGDIFSRTTATVTYTDYIDNGPTNNDDRDQITTEIRQRLGHDVDEGSQLFVEGALHRRDFIASVDDNGFRQGSTGGEALVGLTWDTSGITFVEFGIGYLWEHYKEAAYSDTTGPSFNTRAVWNPTGLLTLSASAKRQVSSTAQVNASSILSTLYSLKLDWEARYNLIVSAEAGLTQEDTQGTNRSDDTTKMALRSRWLIDQHWTLNGSVQRTQRKSSVVNGGFKDTVFLINLTERL